MKLDRN